MRRIRFFAVGAALAAALALPAAAQAAFPGANGKIAFAHCGNPCDIWTMNPDGTNKVDITNTLMAGETAPAWSADGARIAYVRDRSIWVMNADGSGQTQVVPGPTGSSPCVDENTLAAPAWSPDGSKIAFHKYTCVLDPDGGHEVPSWDLYTVNANGTGSALLVTQGADARWSPDATKIGYTHRLDLSDNDIYWITPDGTSSFMVTNTSVEFCWDWSPDGVWMSGSGDSGPYKIHPDGTGQTFLSNIRPESWSPDGTKFAWGRGGAFANDIVVANVDGTGVTDLTNNGNSTTQDKDPDWQPVTLNYVRPKGATPVSVHLTIAYDACTAPNEAHGTPLSFPSCAPPQKTSSALTVGTPDSNGQASNATGLVRYGVVAGNPATPADEADVPITVDVRDVRNSAGLTDYLGELRASASLRITDKDNAQYPGGTAPGTVSDTSLSATVPCAATADTTIGSSCTITTTADSLVPGTVKEGKRAVWELGQVRVYDGGADGDADTTADNELFMDEGIFIP